MQPDGSDVIPPAQGSKRRWWRWAFGLPVLLIVLGIIMDTLSLDVPLSAKAISVPKWITGVLALGALWLAGESAGDWLWSADRTTDPLTKRVSRLVAALFLWGLLLLAISLIRGWATA